jgi:hypothetical protein
MYLELSHRGVFVRSSDEGDGRRCGECPSSISGLVPLGRKVPVYIHAPRPDVVAAQPGVVNVTELPAEEVPTVQFVNTGGRKVLVPSRV